MTLKEMIKSKGFTQEQLAKKVKVTQSTISQWCNGTTAPQRKNWGKVAKTLGISVEELLDCFER